MLAQMDLMDCQGLAVPAVVMHHVVQVESSRNPYAIGVVGERLVRQPVSLAEAVATARMLEQGRYNFSLGLAQVNRHNLKRYGLDSYERAFQACPNVQAGARILAECKVRAGGDWGKAFSCYYSGNFVTGFRHGYVQRVLASMQGGAGTPAAPAVQVAPIPLAAGRTAMRPERAAGAMQLPTPSTPSLRERRGGAGVREHRTPLPNPIVPIVPRAAAPLPAVLQPGVVGATGFDDPQVQVPELPIPDAAFVF